MAPKIFLVLIFVLLLNANTSFAVSQEIQEQHDKALRAAEDDYREARRTLEELSDDAPFQQRKVATEDYLFHAMYMIYRAKVNANITFDTDINTTNSDLTSLVSLGYLGEWPGNPMNAWQPMKVGRPGDPFSPGDIIFVTAPSSHFSRIKTGTAAVSFMIFVNGLAENQGPFGKLVISDEAKQWGSVPNGVLFGYDFWMESEAQAADRLREIEEWKKQHPEEAAKLDSR